MDGFSIGCDGGQLHCAKVVAALGRLHHALCAPLDGFAIGLLGIVYTEGHVLHTIAMQMNMLRDLALRSQCGGDDQTNIALFENITAAVTRARFQASVGNGDKAPGVGKVISSMFGITYIKFDVVKILNRHEILFCH